MTQRWRWLALVALLVAEAMNLLDATIVQVAAPTIHAVLGGSTADVQWLGAAYTLPFALLLITGGRLGDIAGRKRVFLIGVAGFGIASVGCALAPDVSVLIGWRAVQGAAAAFVIPQTFGLVKAMFEGRELAKALGSIGPVMGLAAICGPALGALVVDADLLGWSWRAAFLINIPLVVAVLCCAPVLLENAAADRPRLDLAGTVLAVAGFALVVYPLIEGREWGWPRWTWAIVAAGLATLVGFGVAQRIAAARGRATLVEVSLFADRRFPAALVASTLFFAVMNGLMLVIVLHLQLGLGRDVLSAGLALLPWTAGSAVASWVAGTWLVPRYGARVMQVGLAVLAFGLLATVTAYAHAPAGGWATLSALGVCGVGLGLFTVPFFTTALARVAPHETGSAAGLLNAVQQLGATFGTAALGTVVLRGLDGGDPATATAAVQQAFWIALALTAATAVAAAVMAGPEHPIVGTRRPGRRFATEFSGPRGTVRNHNI
ncbi:MFS transporter [Pseudonocardia cypriaca]|nr:MFS transporter [Pseudonocardia cypriaca]